MRPKLSTSSSAPPAMSALTDNISTHGVLQTSKLRAGSLAVLPKGHGLQAYPVERALSKVWVLYKPVGREGVGGVPGGASAPPAN